MNDITYIDTKDTAAVCREAQYVYEAMYGPDPDGFVATVIDWFIEAFGGRYRDYQPVDMAYHDQEHTMQGTLCYCRLLYGRSRAGAEPKIPADLFRLGLLGILFHDSGYLKRWDDTTGTGAKYTLEHVDRSRAFVAQLLTDKGYSEEDIGKVQRMISCTGLNVDLESVGFLTTLERTVGLSVATSDLLGQMAAQDYVERLADLYEEFIECWEYTGGQAKSLRYDSVDHLLEQTPKFWEGYVKHKLDSDCIGLYRFLSHPYPDGPNEYIDRIEANIDKVKRINERRHSATFDELQSVGSLTA